MDLGSIFLILSLLLLVVLFISRPLLENRSVAVSQEEHEMSALLAERDRLLNALQELDFDYALGKIPEADYPAQRAALVQRGVDVLRRLDEMQEDSSTQDMEERIEAAIMARRADAEAVAAPAGLNGAGMLRPSAVAAGPDDELEALIASRRRGRKEKSAGFCPQCGGAVQKSDRFCPKCGTKVS